MPAYQDIVNDLVATAQTIYGSDIYLGTSSQDYQYISAVAKKIYDSFLTAQISYNAQGPSTAIGTGLDVQVGLNGLIRKSPTYSTAPVALAGTPNQIITGGVAQDVNGNYWSIQSPTTIGASGSVATTATCQTAGPITANPGDINTIATPTLGWTSVTNTAAATVGTSAETDAQLRARQASSTAQPSQTLLEGLQGALAALAGVTRFRVYQNTTSTPDSNGVPAHSIACVVEGGVATDIANAIWIYKGPGTGTYGTTTQDVTDSYGVVTPINYFVDGYTQIDVVYTVKMLTGYTTDTQTAIQNAGVSFLNSLGIGNTVYIGSLWSAALSVIADPKNPAFSVTQVQAVIHLGATLTTALASGTAYTALAVTALTQAIPSGTSLIIGTGTTTQTVTTSAAANVGDTSIGVTSFTANANYATGTLVSLTPGTTDIPIAFNDAAQGVLANIIVNAS